MHWREFHEPGGPLAFTYPEAWRVSAHERLELVSPAGSVIRWVAYRAPEDAGDEELVVVLGLHQRLVVDVAYGVAVGEANPVALPGHAVGQRDLARRAGRVAGDVVDESDLGATLIGGGLEFGGGRHE